MSTEHVMAFVGPELDKPLGRYETAGEAALAAQDAGLGIVRVVYLNGHEATIRIARRP